MPARLVKNPASETRNMQEYSNHEAVRLMNSYLEVGSSFAIETNLADKDTWKFLLKTQESGYELEVIYISLNDLSILNARIEERTRRGEHFVRPDVVLERYLSGLNLLDHYFDYPSRLKLLDNTESPTILAEIEKGKIIKQKLELPLWVTQHLGKHFDLELKPKEEKVRDLDNIEAVKKFYSKLNQDQPSQKNQEKDL